MAEEQPMSDYFFPKLQAVEALAPYRLRTTWSTGEVLDVDVGDILRKYPGACADPRPRGLCARAYQ